MRREPDFQPPQGRFWLKVWLRPDANWAKKGSSNASSIMTMLGSGHEMLPFCLILHARLPVVCKRSYEKNEATSIEISSQPPINSYLYQHHND